MRLCDLDEIKIQVKRKYEDCHGYSGNKKTIYREAILAVRSILHSAKTIDAVPVVRCDSCVLEGKCFAESNFRFAGIENPFCCAGKLKGNVMTDDVR